MRSLSAKPVRSSGLRDIQNAPAKRAVAGFRALPNVESDPSHCLPPCWPRCSKAVILASHRGFWKTGGD